MDPLQQVLEQLREVRADLKDLRSELSSGLADLKAASAKHATWIDMHEGSDKTTHEGLHREIGALRDRVAAVERKIAYYVGLAGAGGAVLSFLAPKLAAAL
jgi:predicted  nucleic acid-binding Zn-ribbon protein